MGYARFPGAAERPPDSGLGSRPHGESPQKLFREARPVRSGITLLYNTESLRTQQKNAAVSDDGRYEGRKASATMNRVAGPMKP